MIAARDPQEFIPSGRQQIQYHPGPSQICVPVETEKLVGSEFLLKQFEQVSIHESNQPERWFIRKSLDTEKHERGNIDREEVHKKCDVDINCKSDHLEEYDSSFIWKCSDPLQHKVRKRVSDLQGSAKKRHSDELLLNEFNKSSNLNKSALKSNYLKCKSPEFMEEELYVKDNVVIWSKGLVSAPTSYLCDFSRTTVCSYTSYLPINHAKWCTFYCERPSFECAAIEKLYKLEEPSGTPLPSICIIDDQKMQVFTADNEDFVTALPFEVGALWCTKFGVLLEHFKKVDKYGDSVEVDEDIVPTVFSLSHPLDETIPVAIHQGSMRLIDDPSLRIVFTCEKPSICMMYDNLTGQHTVYCIRKVRNEEWMEISNKLSCTASSVHNLSFKVRNQKPTVSPFSTPTGSRPSSAMSFSGSSHQQSSKPSNHHQQTSKPNSNQQSTKPNSQNQQSSKPNSMATISRCQSPTASSVMVSNPWVRSQRNDTSLGSIGTNLDVTEIFHHADPIICFDHVWTDTFAGQNDGGPATKVFLIDDLVERWYLCYLVPPKSQLFLVCVDFSNTNMPSFGMLTSISAVDAVPIPHLHMIAILEHNSSIVLYTGLTMVGKLHVGGVLAQYAPSPSEIRTQFISPFPKRSTLLPHYGTPSSDLKMMEHLISPVTPSIPLINRKLNVSIPIAMNSSQLSDSKVCLNGLRDAIEDRMTLQYSDGTFYRIILPTLASSTLVESCLNSLRQTLPRDDAINLLSKWYARRNSLGSNEINLEEEWNIFSALLFELLGYDIDQSNDVPLDVLMTPSSASKRQRQSTSGSDQDWQQLLNSDYHKYNYEHLVTHLHLKNVPQKSLLVPKLSNVQINTNSILFNDIKVIHYTLHLVYEDIKLNSMRTEELPFLAQFLSKLAIDLSLKNYIIHYWKDFPDQCNKYDANIEVIEAENLKNVIAWPCMTEIAESIMEYIYNLLSVDVPLVPYPYVFNVNNRSRAVVQLCGMLVKSVKTKNNHVDPDSFVKLAVPFVIDMPSTPRLKETEAHYNIYEKMVIFMTELGITSRCLDSLPAGVSFLLYSALWKCRESPPKEWSTECYSLLNRLDLVCQAELIKQSNVEVNANNETVSRDSSLETNGLSPNKKVEEEEDDGMEDIDRNLLKLRFPEDHRVAEVRRLLQSSKPVPITLVQRPDVSDHDFIEEQEKHLYAICARTMALPVARGMFTLRTLSPVATEPLPFPKLCLSGKVPPRGVNVELSHIDVPPNMSNWPQFHNGVASGLRISPNSPNINSAWIVFNNLDKNETSMEYSGFLMALGLNGHLPSLSTVDLQDFFSKLSEMTTIGMLLGLSASLRGKSCPLTTKILSLHVECLIPPTPIELEVPHSIQVAALLGVGLVYQGTAHRSISEVLLTEIGRPPGPEMENSIDRESYSLAAGLGLGLVTLGVGGRQSSITDLNVPDKLHYYMNGGNKKLYTGSQREKYKVPSFQIREGSTVNLDVTAPGATLALGLMYMRTNNQTVANWMTPPETHYLLNYVRPDFLLLRIVAKSLIMWDSITPSKNWIENQVPDTIRKYCMVRPSITAPDLDYEGMNQAYCNIIAGACFSVGLKYAGTADNEVFATLLHFCRMFISLTGKSIAELAGKPTIESCLNVVLISVCMVMAGTGNLEILRIIRHLRRRIGLASSAIVTYGSHLAIHMALGLLFIGSGRYTLSNSPENVAILICAFYPKFPTHSSDNKYHLQAFRHLYVLAVEPRLFIPKDIISGRMCYANLKLVNLKGVAINSRAPCILPSLETLSKVMIDDERYWSIEFERGRNWEQLLHQLKSSGLIEVKQRSGCLTYIDGKMGSCSKLTRALPHSKIEAWDPPPEAIASFSSDFMVHQFAENILIPDKNIKGSNEEEFLSKVFTKSAYDCIVKDKEIVFSNFVSMLKVVENLQSTPNTLNLWQFKLLCAQVLKTPLSINLVNVEILFAMRQRLLHIINSWQVEINDILKSYALGENINCDMTRTKKLAAYVVYHDIPLVNEIINCDVNSLDFFKLMSILSSKNISPETIFMLSQVLNIAM